MLPGNRVLHRAPGGPRRLHLLRSGLLQSRLLLRATVLLGSGLLLYPSLLLGRALTRLLLEGTRTLGELPLRQTTLLHRLLHLRSALLPLLLRQSASLRARSPHAGPPEADQDQPHDGQEERQQDEHEVRL